MYKKLGTPWDFANEFTSPNRKLSLEFGYAEEVAMGAPIAGECFLKTGKGNFTLNGTFGGPAIWNESSDKAAIPYWTPYRSQKLAIIDVNEMKILISEKKFRVIQVSKFENGVIYGIDSPIYEPETIEFNVETEKYLKELKID